MRHGMAHDNAPVSDKSAAALAGAVRRKVGHCRAFLFYPMPPTPSWGHFFVFLKFGVIFISFHET
jgi:hypothetical protein